MSRKLSKKSLEAVKAIQNKIKKTILQTGFNKNAKPVFKLGNDRGIFIIHGFDDTAFIMKEYADFFIEKGFTVYNTTLSGRGMKLRDFAKTSYKEWLSDGEESYLLLKKTVKRLFIAGFSTGATIAINLSANLAKNEKPDGLILLSPAIFIASRFIPITLGLAIINILKFFNPYPKKLKNRHLIFIDSRARKIYNSPARRSSFKGIIELLKLIKETKKIINKINVPVLIIYSKKDIVVSPYSSIWLYNKIKNVGYNKILRLEKSGHPVMVDLEKKKVFNESIEFVLKNLP